jgi:ABC-type sulfate transport system permease component
VLPGFDLSLGLTLFYLGLIVLLPLSAVFLKTFTLSWTPSGPPWPRRGCWPRTG